MSVERKALICYLLGYTQASKKNIARADAVILLDQVLISMNQPPITQEERDYFKDLDAEIDFAVLTLGIGRKEVRHIVLKKGLHRK